MKKTISINISGVIFHIEEDGYDKLKNYLTTVQQYFSTYEDSQEIVTDIENRIAEKLLAKLKAADKQAVSLEDVNELTAAMGTVADFEAVEEEEVLVTSGGRNSASSIGQGAKNSGPYQSTSNPMPHAPSTTFEPRRLVRDLRRKTLGGVCAGLAHYFNIDVVWVRLIFLALFLAMPPLGQEFGAGVSGFTFIVYIAMWIALPGVTTIEDDKTVKKFFRNPENKVLGGVASGIAAYFGVDTGVIRLLFVLGIVFFGVGFLFYIVLWMIAPQANTLTEKMEMQGQPITLSNIEHSIKQNLNIHDLPNSESTLTRILLFPFRAIATIIGGLGSALGPLMTGVMGIIRIFAGVLLLVIAFSLMVACLAALGAALGINQFGPGGDFPPFEFIRAEVTAPMVLSAFLVGFIPAFGLAILGIMLITMRNVITSRTALTVGGVWLVALVILGGTVTPVISSFQRRGTVEETKVLNVPARIPTFDMKNVENDADWRPSIDLKGYEGATLNLVQYFRSQGRTRAEAQANARQIKYVYTIKDSTVYFDETLELAPKAHFRGQDLDMDLMIPYEKPFRMTREFARFVRNEFGGKEIDRMESSIWQFTKADGLVCINYPREKDRDYNDEDDDVTDLTEDVQSAVTNELGDDFDHIGDHTRQFNVREFSKVDVGGAFVVRFRKGDSYKVVADGREKDLDDIEVNIEGDKLKVSLDKKGIFNWKNRKRIGLTITIPKSIEELQLTGASKASLTGFEHYDHLTIGMSGACRTVFDGDVNRLDLDLTGASNAVLRGRVSDLDAELSGACKLEANSMHIDRAKVDANGASHADFGHVGTLDSNTSGASKVSRGE
ncbi:hypothetical protein GCM10028805_18470 [Spirosoma harenae]